LLNKLAAIRVQNTLANINKPSRIRTSFNGLENYIDKNKGFLQED
jgi:hypothetical protein